MTTSSAPPISPLNGSVNVVIERRIDRRELQHRWRSELDVDVSKELAGANEILRCRCVATGLHFFHPSSLAGCAPFYQQLQKFSWYYASSRWEYSQALSFLPPSSTVLEVGSGWGKFLKQATDAGHHVNGIELNPDGVAAATSQGLHCQQRDLEELAASSPGTFDAVCSFQVLEHVSNPRLFIEQCRRLLRPGGLLLFSVPNSDGWIRLKDFLLDLPPHHVLGWSAQSFRAAAALFDLSVQSIMFEPLPHSQIENYLAAQRSRWQNPVVRRLIFNRFSLPTMAAVLRSGALPVNGQSMLAVFKLRAHE